jgi:hypothetical protein
MDGLHRLPPGWWVCILGCIVSVAGCQRQSTPQKLDTEALAQYGSLPGLRASHDSNLTDELARLESEEATPEQLSPQVEPDGQSTAATDLGQQMNKIVSPKEAEFAFRRIDNRYPHAEFTFSPTGLETLREIGEPFVEAFARYRQLLARPDLEFRVDLRQGLLADLSFIDQAKFLHRLEGIAAAEALTNGTPAEAVFPLRNMLTIDARLARLHHVVPRLTAASLRADAMRVLEAIAQHPQTSLPIHVELYRLVAQQLNEWPNDATAWIGDRAQGLHTYELIRDGYLTSLLSRGELDQLREDRQFTAFLRATADTINADQWYYLQAMRRIIQQCDEPYYRRKETLHEVETELRELEDTSQYPVIAAKLLLKDIALGHRLQAADRALCEAWALALAGSTGSAQPEFGVNPLTGEPYKVQTSPNHLTVGNIDLLEQTLVARIPRLQEKEAASLSFGDE